QKYPKFLNSKAVMKKDSKPLLPPVPFPSQGAKPLSFPLTGYSYEVRNLAGWLQEYLDEMWDQQIEADLASGKLDRLIAQAEEDIAAHFALDRPNQKYHS
ncbi:hypothetical protein MEO39_04185, partial [Dolichospermum sp. ST_sed2]|nr:hypothetical protein [Dolichospermum sp. ST_sed2]